MNVFTEIDAIRIFDNSLDHDDLKWHFDEEDRIIELIEGSEWYFQFDNELPIELKLEDPIFIPKGVYHRLIKGNSILKLEVLKLKVLKLESGESNM